MCCNFSCLSGDDGSTCIPIISNNVEIVASQDSSINSKARGSNKVKLKIMSYNAALSFKFINHIFDHLHHHVGELRVKIVVKLLCT